MDESTFICFSSFEGSTGSLVTNDLLEVGPLARRSDVATPIRPITGRHWLSPASFARHPVSASLRRPASQRRDVGFTMFRSSDMDELAPASTPAVVMSVCSKLEVEQPTACRFGWSLSASLARYFDDASAVHLGWACHPV